MAHVAGIEQERFGRAGFTLIELIVVIGLLSLLFIALLPFITQGEQQQKISTCQALVAGFKHTIDDYANDRRSGDYPPDDFEDRTLRTLKVPSDNGVNSGIESCLLFLNRAESRSGRVPERDDSLGNTDGDKLTFEIAKLGTTEKVEMLDPWGNPFAYFHFRNYEREQHYQLGPDAPDAGQPVAVTAHKIKGSYANPQGFQLFSAGPDHTYNTDDDIGNFTIEQ